MDFTVENENEHYCLSKLIYANLLSGRKEGCLLPGKRVKHFKCIYVCHCFPLVKTWTEVFVQPVGKVFIGFTLTFDGNLLKCSTISFEKERFMMLVQGRP